MASTFPTAYSERGPIQGISSPWPLFYTVAEASHAPQDETEAAFIAMAEAAFEAFEATGLHITLEETKAWATALHTNPHTPIPPCHV